MATEAEIREAERTRLEEVVAEHGTEAEIFSLLFSGLLRAGVSLQQLAAAAKSGESPGRFPPDPECLARLTHRIERRVRLKLPRAQCAADPPSPYCDCLERALDQPGDDGKRAVLKLAAAFHKRTRREPIALPAAPDPQESPAAPQEPTESVEDPLPRPEPTPKAEPPIVHRTRKWFDPEPSRFSDMKF
jgi:hypothetical protein